MRLRRDPDDRPIRIKAAELRRLVDLLREGYEDALPDDSRWQRRQDFKAGWDAAMEALDEVANQLR